ncbi:MAG: hypothetical protein J0I79_32995 [Mesorhizobium sp.]|nr:hypothetical protein [Mesorhizobium sp.]
MNMSIFAADLCADHADATGRQRAVSIESGFGSLSAFNKSFCKLAGITPSGFRKSVAGAR